MTVSGAGITVVALMCAMPAGAIEQAPPMKSSEVSAFLGTWALAMSTPEGAKETVRIWDEGGLVRATVHSERFPPLPVTGILKDSDMLVLTLTRLKNGKPVRAVVALTLDGDIMSFSQMLEFSQIMRGSGKKTDGAAK